MTIPKVAIEKAIEGGWVPRDLKRHQGKTPAEIVSWFNAIYPTQESIRQNRHEPEYALDPMFWQALGKALGWDADYKPGNRPWWHIQAFEFYDLILTGEPTDDYWNELLQIK